MAVTDLTGTKWRFNSSITTVNFYNFMINFTCNNNNYTTISFGQSLDYDFSLYYDNTIVYEGGWKNESYRLIEITGGTSATNANLISFIQSNAEQIIDSPVLPSFSDVEVTPHDGYITMTINGVDFNLKTAASVSLISFSIIVRGNTPSFNAEEGMTWEEWIASEYNTAGFSISGINVVYTDLVVMYDGSAVTPSDVIVAGRQYYTVVGA